jgi:hypothetical protein
LLSTVTIALRDSHTIARNGKIRFRYVTPIFFNVNLHLHLGFDVVYSLSMLIIKR